MRAAMIVAAVLVVVGFGRSADAQWYYSYSGGAYPAYPSTQNYSGGYPGANGDVYGGVPVGQMYGSAPVGASYGGYWGSAYYSGYPRQSYFRAYSPQQSVYPRSYTIDAPTATNGYLGNAAPAQSRAPNPVYSNFSYYPQSGFRRFGAGRTAGTYVPRVYTHYQPRSGGLFDR